ncbi:hypothetical protein DOTSEDRAFT_64818 [Dothistroma septosporum NZE10]|uniref:AMP-dependent synthetase/ligase domain-containing protein n=1 Tax=Dothistroma septosporum (strain NZE10 / CBS 128990) TaxID=675120 RepID=N1PJK4_DOTSN|nr:hypothetical protein DOTSEDRAFT_64818 [Dothistroma septosporum NZE10]
MTTMPSGLVNCAPLTTEVPGSENRKGETIPRRNSKYLSSLRSTPEIGVNTAYDILRRSGHKYGHARAIGKRRFIRSHEEANWTYYELSAYEYSSFNDFERVALNAGKAFRSLGLQPRRDRVHMFGATHPNWLATAHGAMSQSLTLVTSYDSLAAESLAHVIQETRPTAMFVDRNLLAKVLSTLAKAQGVQYIIYNDDESLLTSRDDAEDIQEDIENLKQSHPQLKAVYTWGQFMKIGQTNGYIEPTPPAPDDLACIMYTSGSTAMPKGVLISHKNLIAAITGLDSILGAHIGPNDGLLAYLPLAHMLEFAFESACLYWGATLGYGSAKTMFDRSMRNCSGDIIEFQPTVLVGVPAVWEAVKKGILSKINNLDAGLQDSFGQLIHPGGVPGMMMNGVDDPLLQGVRASMGGQLRLCITGGGPIARGTQRFISESIAPLISGYGLTETAAMGALMDPAHWTDAALGEIPASVEVKLVDYEQYSTSTVPPQGEIWMRGDSITSGYLNNEAENQAAFTRDGWFRSGDIGEFDNLGQLRIIDRKKNLVKALNGEYIALERLESIYRSCGVVLNICVSMTSEESRPMAVVLPDEAALRLLAERCIIAVEGCEKRELYCKPEIANLVLCEIRAAGKKEGLASFEMVDRIVLAEEDWTTQSGLVTSVGKLNRRGIQERYGFDLGKAV